MRNAIFLPGSLIAKADVLAARVGMSRSQLCEAAIVAFLARSSDAGVTAALNRVYSMPYKPDALLAKATRAALRRSEWT